MQPIWRTQPGTSRTGHPPHRDSDDGGMAGSPPRPWWQSHRHIIRRHEALHWRGRNAEEVEVLQQRWLRQRRRRWQDSGQMSRMETSVNKDDFFDGNEDNNQQEIRRWRVDGILLSPATLLRWIGRGLPQTGTNNGGGGESGDDDVKDNDDISGGWGSRPGRLPRPGAMMMGRVPPPRRQRS